MTNETGSNAPLPPSQGKRSSRRKGQSSRDRMRAERSRAPEVNPAPSGAAGGQYKPLTPDQIEAVYTTAFRMLEELGICLLYTSPSPRDKRQSRMPSSA